MKNNIITCPYRAINKKTCSHKGCKLNKGGEKKCYFKYPHNCELFIQWVDISDKHRKDDSEALK